MLKSIVFMHIRAAIFVQTITYIGQTHDNLAINSVICQLKKN